MDTGSKINIFAGFIPLGILLSGCGDGTPEQAMNKAVSFARNNEWGKAAKIADRLAKQNPSLAEAHVLRAVTSERSGDRQTALDAARRAVEINPDNFVTLYTLARLYAADPARSSEANARLMKAWLKRKDDIRVKILLCNVAMESNSPRAQLYLHNLARIPKFSNSAIQNRPPVFSGGKAEGQKRSGYPAQLSPFPRQLLCKKAALSAHQKSGYHQTLSEISGFCRKRCFRKS